MKRSIVFTGILLSLAMYIQAQNACDKLYKEALRLQQTMTISSQNQAIAQLKKAKECYDAAEKQALCQSQIAISQNIIKYIRAQQNTQQDSNSQVNDNASPSHKNATIALSNSQIVFDAQGGYEKVKVESNYNDWIVKDLPDWVTVYKSADNWLLIEALPNGENVRTATITLQCGKQVATLGLAQNESKTRTAATTDAIDITIITNVPTHRTIDMDKDMGIAENATYKLSSGSHHIKLEADGYQRQSKMLDVKANGNNTFIFNMKPKK